LLDEPNTTVSTPCEPDFSPSVKGFIPAELEDCSCFDEYSVHIDPAYYGISIDGGTTTAGDWLMAAFRDICRDVDLLDDVSIPVPPSTITTSSYKRAIRYVLCGYGNFDPPIANVIWETPDEEVVEEGTLAYFHQENHTITILGEFWTLGSKTRKTHLLHELIHAIDDRIRYSPSSDLRSFCGWGGDNATPRLGFIQGPSRSGYEFICIDMSEYNARFVSFIYAGVDPCIADVVAKYWSLDYSKSNNYNTVFFDLCDYSAVGGLHTFTSAELGGYGFYLLSECVPEVQDQLVALFIANILLGGILSFNIAAYMESMASVVTGSNEYLTSILSTPNSAYGH